MSYAESEIATQVTKQVLTCSCMSAACSICDYYFATTFRYAAPSRSPYLFHFCSVSPKLCNIVLKLCTNTLPPSSKHHEHTDRQK